MTNRHLAAAGLAALFSACIVAANWTLNRWGMVPLLGFGPIVPAGLYWAGLSFGVRDALQEVGGTRLTVAAIVVGTGIAWSIAPSFAVASGVAFLLAELLDLAVYTPLRDRRWVTAVVASNIAGSVLDSLVFLSIAFGTTTGWVDLTIGKAIMILPGLAVVWAARRR